MRQRLTFILAPDMATGREFARSIGVGPYAGSTRIMAVRTHRDDRVAHRVMYGRPDDRVYLLDGVPEAAVKSLKRGLAYMRLHHGKAPRIQRPKA